MQKAGQCPQLLHNPILTVYGLSHGFVEAFFYLLIAGALGQHDLGYQDLLGICMRLALVDAMYPDEKPFLVLDDPFVNLDEEKVVHGNELLSKIAREYQILYFTCHSSRM